MHMLLSSCLINFVVLSLVGAVFARSLPSKSSFEVKSLPGWKGDLPSKWYSGFLDGGPPPSENVTEMFFHFIFLESQRSPKDDPLIVWYNGGPGASSMFGLFVELGPLLLNQLSVDNEEFQATGIPQLQYNDWSWNKRANILVLDSPPPVGFSFCEPIGPSGPGTSCGPWNDTLVASANGHFFGNFFQLFSEFASNDLYITGESYAGVYVPLIVQELLDNYPTIASQLRGFAIGDGCLGNQVLCGNNKEGVMITNVANGPYYEIMFMFGHGQISNQFFFDILDTCGVENLKSGQNLTTICESMISEFYFNLGGYFVYNLYDNCPVQLFKRKRAQPEWPYPPFPGPGFPCAGLALGLWVNLTETRVALNVQPDNYWFNADNGEDFVYDPNCPSVLPILADALSNPQLTVLVYNGDADPSLNSFVTQAHIFNYFNSLGFNVTEAWRPWTLDGQQAMGGYVAKYEENFAFATVRGAGHMVPEYSPMSAAAMLEAFLSSNAFLPYIPPSK